MVNSPLAPLFFYQGPALANQSHRAEPAIPYTGRLCHKFRSVQEAIQEVVQSSQKLQMGISKFIHMQNQHKIRKILMAQIAISAWVKEDTFLELFKAF